MDYDKKIEQIDERFTLVDKALRRLSIAIILCGIATTLDAISIIIINIKSTC